MTILRVRIMFAGFGRDECDVGHASWFLVLQLSSSRGGARDRYDLTYNYQGECPRYVLKRRVILTHDRTKHDHAERICSAAASREPMVKLEETIPLHEDGYKRAEREIHLPLICRGIHPEGARVRVELSFPPVL